MAASTSTPLSRADLVGSQDKAYRFLTCANDDGCAERGTSNWEDNAFVNSWQEEMNGNLARFRDSFQDISSGSFKLVSEGSIRGKTKIIAAKRTCFITDDSPIAARIA
jgi:hypothetical protein